MWGIIPAAGNGTRIKPLAFSKELLPVGSWRDGSIERPKAVSEYLVERMAAAGTTKICFVIGPNKSDILQYYGGRVGSADICYAVQPQAGGLCDAIFRALPFIPEHQSVLIGLPDTIWFPENGFSTLPNDILSFLLFPVENPEFFDAVLTDADGRVIRVLVKQPERKTRWVWGAFKMPVHVLWDLYEIWSRRSPRDEYIGTLVNEYISRGGTAAGIKSGELYVDVGTLNGYRAALQALQNADQSALSRTTLPDDNSVRVQKASV